jgi:hypothetical protein
MPRRVLPLLIALALVATSAACGDDDAGEAGGGTGENTTAPIPDAAGEPGEGDDDTADEPETAAPYDGYADHASDQYAGTDNWICHPELDDVCTDLSTTVVESDGTEQVEEAEKASDANFDCFYVYPTTSGDETTLADLDVDESESDTVRAQVAGYGSVCRVFAPAYRQITIAGLFSGEVTAEDWDEAYGDVLDAWQTYVNEHNDGRGVVLIGHSQGAGMLRRLVAEEIDPEPALRELLVSALLLGSGVAVPEGEEVGGDFEEIPVCASDEDTGCVISFASFPAGADPAAAESRFGRVDGEDQQAVCVDPTALDGEDELADAVVPTVVSLLGGAVEEGRYDTPFVSFPDALRTECVEQDGFHFLSVELADPDDPRGLEALVEETLGPSWGLHLVDANLAKDNLIRAVEHQAEAHAAG